MADETKVSQISTLCTSAATAIAAANYATAQSCIDQAQALLVALPNESRGDNSVFWSTSSATLTNLQNRLNRLRNAAGGIRFSKITVASESGVEDY